jgi:hypothetical protein
MTSPDQGPSKLMNPSTLNRYAYGGLDPVNHTDPSGNIFMNDPAACQMLGGMATMLYIAYFQWNGNNGIRDWQENSPAWIEGVDCGFPPVVSWMAVVLGVIEPGEAGGGSAGGVAASTDFRSRIKNPNACDTAVIQAMDRAWQRSSLGTQGVEEGFALVRGPRGTYTIVDLPTTNAQRNIRLKLPVGTFALYHVHPNNGDPLLSPQDLDTAKENNIWVMAFSRNGLWMADPTSLVKGKPTETKLADDTDWRKPCPQ